MTIAVTNKDCPQNFEINAPACAITQYPSANSCSVGPRAVGISYRDNADAAAAQPCILGATIPAEVNTSADYINSHYIDMQRILFH